MPENPVFWVTLLAATASVLSSAAAWSAVVFNRGTRREQRAETLSAREQQIYQLAVLEPVQEYLAAYVEAVTGELMTGLSDMSRMSAEGASHGVVTNRRRELTSAINRARVVLVWRVTAGVKAWGDQDLLAKVEESLDLLEDRIALTLGQWDLAPEITPTVSSIVGMLEAHAIDMLTLARQYSPGLKALKPPAAGLPQSLTPSRTRRRPDNR